MTSILFKIPNLDSGFELSGISVCIITAPVAEVGDRKLLVVTLLSRWRRASQTTLSRRGFRDGNTKTLPDIFIRSGFFHFPVPRTSSSGDSAFSVFTMVISMFHSEHVNPPDGQYDPFTSDS